MLQTTDQIIRLPASTEFSTVAIVIANRVKTISQKDVKYLIRTNLNLESDQAENLPNDERQKLSIPPAFKSVKLCIEALAQTNIQGGRK